MGSKQWKSWMGLCGAGALLAMFIPWISMYGKSATFFDLVFRIDPSAGLSPFPFILVLIAIFSGVFTSLLMSGSDKASLLSGIFFSVAAIFTFISMNQIWEKGVYLILNKSIGYWLMLLFSVVAAVLSWYGFFSEKKRSEVSSGELKEEEPEKQEEPEKKILCPNCHAELSEDDAFCKKCGTAIIFQQKEENQ